MRLLLDTHILLWAVTSPEKLSPGTKALLLDTANDLVFSVISLWEVAIKSVVKKAGALIDPRLLRHELLRHHYHELPIHGEHALHVAQLPLVHRDPFDRMLISQALIEGMVLVTADKTIARYPGLIHTV